MRNGQIMQHIGKGWDVFLPSFRYFRPQKVRISYNCYFTAYREFREFPEKLEDWSRRQAVHVFESILNKSLQILYFPFTSTLFELLSIRGTFTFPSSKTRMELIRIFNIFISFLIQFLSNTIICINNNLFLLYIIWCVHFIKYFV